VQGVGSSELSELISVGLLEILEVGVLFFEILREVKKGSSVAFGNFDVEFTQVSQLFKGNVCLY